MNGNRTFSSLLAFAIITMFTISVSGFEYTADTGKIEHRAAEFSAWSRSTITGNPEIRIDHPHLGPICAASFSPDGRLLATGSYDQTLKLRDVSTGAVIQTYRGHEGAVISVELSPDGRHIISGSADSTVVVWNTVSGESLMVFEGHDDEVRAVRYSPDGRIITSAAIDGTIRFWNAETGRCLHTIDGLTDPPQNLVYSADGRFIASGHEYGSVRLWDAKTYHLIREWDGSDEWIGSMSFSADSRIIAVNTGSGGIRLYETESGSTVGTVDGQKSIFTPDGQYLATSFGSDLYLRDNATGRIMEKLRGHTDRVVTLNCSPDGRYISSISEDNTLRIWDTSSQGTPVRIFGGYNFPRVPISVKFSPDGRSFAFSERGGLLEYGIIGIRDAASGILLRYYPEEISGRSTIDYTPDSCFLLTGWHNKNTLRIRDAITGELQMELEGHHFSISPDGRTLASGSGKVIRLYDRPTGDLLKIIEGHAEAILCLDFSPDNRILASGSMDGSVRLWNTETGRLIRTIDGGSPPIWSLAFSSDGRSLAFSSGGREIQIRDTDTGEIVQLFNGHIDRVTDLAFANSDHHLISSSYDGTVMIWDTGSGTHLRTLNGHTGSVGSLSVSPDGRYVVSASSDSTIKLWALQDGELLYTSVTGRDGSSLTWTPEGYFHGDQSLAMERVFLVDGLSSRRLGEDYGKYHRPDIVLARVNRQDIETLEGYTPDRDAIAVLGLQTEEHASDFESWAKDLPGDDPSINVALPHTNHIESLSFSPNGQFIVSASSDSSVRIWDTATGALVHRIDEMADSVGFTADGKHIVTSAMNDEPIKSWNLESGLLYRSTGDQSGGKTAVAMGFDGRHVVTASNDGSIRLWNTGTGELMRTIREPQGHIDYLAVSPDGSRIATATNKLMERGVHVWDSTSGEQLGSYGFSSYRPGVLCLAISPDGRYFAVATEDKVIRIRDMRSGRTVSTLRGHTDFVVTLAFSSDGRHIATGSYDGTVRCWDPTTGETLWINDPFTITTQANMGPSRDWGIITSLAFSRDGCLLAVGSSDRSIRLLDSSHGNIESVLGGKLLNAETLASSPDGRYFLVGSGSRVELRELATGRLRRGYNINPPGRGIAADFSPDGRHFVIGTLVLASNSESSNFIPTLIIMDLQSSDVIRIQDGHQKTIESVSYTRDGRRIISASDDAVVIREAATGRILMSFGGDGGITALSDDGRFLATASQSGGSIGLRNPESGALIQSLDVPCDGDNEIEAFLFGGAQTLSFSRNGRFLIAGTGHGYLRTWDTESGELISRYNRHSHPVESVSHSHNGHFFASGDSAGIVKLWDTGTGELLVTMNGHVNSIRSVRFLPGDEILLTGSRDSTVKAWRIPDGKLLYSTISDGSGNTLTWTPDGYFGGSEILARDKVHIVDGLSTYSIDQFFEAFNRPDVIRARMAGDDTAMSGTRLFDTIAPPPELLLEGRTPDGRFVGSPEEISIMDGTATIRVLANDMGGGIEEIRIFHNGSRIVYDSRNIGVRTETGSMREYTVSLVSGENTFKAVGFTPSRIQSIPASLTIRNDDSTADAPELWAVSVGINSYRNSRYNLNYAISDASGFLNTIKEAGNGLYSDIHDFLIVDEEATRDGIISAIEKVRDESDPEDVFMFFYAGHGIAMETEMGGRSEFFFIPTEVTQMTDINMLDESGISGPEFENMVSTIPARKQLLVLDACNSGAINAAFGIRGAAEEIALARLGRATGSALIAASRDDQFAQEFAELGQGALTKALLDGLEGDAAQAGGEITAGSLKSYVETTLPVITEQYLGTAQYPTGFIFGQDFPIGLSR